MTFPSRDTTSNDRRGTDSTRLIDRGFVTSRSGVESGAEPQVSVEVGQGATLDARVLHDVAGDRGVPAEGDEVYVLRRNDSIPVVLGVVADEHGGYTDAYRFAHPHSDAHVQFNDDGSVTVVADDGTTVDISSGTVKVDDGTTPVVTDVETTTDVDGHVTSVSPVTDDSVQL